MASLSLVSLANLAGRMPAQLSGGQQQRVAVARAIVFEPSVLLMDEPLGALDKKLRRNLQIEMRQLQRKLGITTIYVTHDQEEAFTMSDRIVVMNDGQILQVGEPTTLYESPANAFVADFVGDVNRFEGIVWPLSKGVVKFLAAPDFQLVLQAPGLFESASSAIYCIRPDRVQVAPEACSNTLAATVRGAIFDGSRIVLQLELGQGTGLTAHVPWARSRAMLTVGQQIQVGWDATDGILFKADA